MENIFEKFTGKYSLSKTLRFELKPTPQTEELLKKVNLQGKTPVQVDQEINELYNKEMKPMFDSLHEQFIDESLKNVDFQITDLENFERNYLALKKLNKDKKSNAVEIKKLIDPKNGEITKLQSKLRDVVVVQFNKTAMKWKGTKDTKGTLNELETEMYDKKGKKRIKIDIKAVTPALLKEENVLAILAHFNPSKIAQIKRFQGFFTYFSGFNINRENYYTSKAKATGVANRIVNTNLPVFLDNKQKFEEISEKIPALKEYERCFKFENYKNCITQKNIDDFNENIRGKINAEKNLFCQQENANIRDQKNKVSLPNLKKLQKQIGCKTKQQREQEEKGESIYPKYLDKVGLGFQITQDAKGKYQVWEALEYLTGELRPKIEKIKESYQNFFDRWKDYKLDEIWFRKEAINTISGRWFGGDNWNIIAKALKYTGTGKLEKGEYKAPPFVSLQDLKEAMEALESGVDFDVKKSKRKIKVEQNKEATKKFSYSAGNLFKDDYKAYYKESLFETLLDVWQNEVDFKFKQIFDGYKNEQGKDVPAFLKKFEENKNTPFDKDKKDGEKSIYIEIVKNLVEEGYLRLFQLTKYHNLEKKGEVDPRQTENKFYDALNEFWEENKIVTYHKAFQATLTKKPYSKDKIKLNFECGTLLGGWSQDYESFGTLIFQKGSKFYLGIIKGTKFSADEVSGLYQNITIGNEANRLVYLVQKIDRKNPPRWFIRSKGTTFSPMVREGLLNPSEILDIYDSNLYSKTENKETYKKYLPKLLDYFKDGFRKHKDFAGFKSEFNWFDSKEYDTVADFYNHTADMCYRISWEKINFEALDNLVKQNRIYLFQIYNKDFELDENIGKNKYGIGFKAEEATGIHNSHTQLFVELLKPKNVKKLKLLGGGELFFRNPSKEKRYKKDKRGKEVLDAKRYYEQKYFLHFPIEIKGSERNLKNSFVNQKVVDEQDKIKIIGIDRGEKNLLYYSVLDSNGIMIDQGSLNKIEVKQPIEEKEVKTEYENGEIKMWNS